MFKPQCCCLLFYYCQGAYRSWKVIEFKIEIFQVWKVMESDPSPGKSWKINQKLNCGHYGLPFFDSDLVTNHTHFCNIQLCILFIYICQLKRAVLTYTRYLISKCISQSDLFDIHSIKLSWKDMENGHKWSWKVLENAHKKFLESQGKTPCIIVVDIAL